MKFFTKIEKNYENEKNMNYISYLLYEIKRQVSVDKFIETFEF